MRRSDAANSHQPPLPSLDLQFITNHVLRYAAGDPTPRLLGVRMAVEEDSHIRSFEFSERIPTRLFGTLERGEQGRPVPLPLPEIIHNAGNAQPLRPDRAGVRGPETIRGRLAANAPPIRDTRAASRANRMPPNCRTHTLPRPDPEYSVPARPRCHPAPELATRREPQRQPALASTGRPGREHRKESPRSSSFLQLTARERLHHPGPRQYGANHVAQGQSHRL